MCWEKKAVFRSGDKAAYANIKKVVWAAFAKAKLAYKNKTESRFSVSELKSVWNGMKSMTDLQKSIQSV